MVKKSKLSNAPNTLDYDPNNPDHAHIKHAIAMRVIGTFTRDHMKATIKRPGSKQVTLTSSSTKAYYHGSRPKG